MGRPLLVVFIILSLALSAAAQTVNGRITSASETGGLPGVNVVVKGTARGAISDADGRFSVEAQPNDVLIFSFVGYITQAVVYTGQPVLEVLLIEESRELDEVVVVGYSSVQKRDITGSVASVKASAFKDIAITGLDQAL